MMESKAGDEQEGRGRDEQRLRCRMLSSTSQSKMTNTTIAMRLMRKMLVPSTVYFQYLSPTAR